METTTKRLEKAKATRKANAEKFAQQTITIDAHWQIRREDEMNWGIYKDGKDQKSYHRKLSNALAALPHKILDSEAKGTLKDLQRIIRAISDRIENALHPQ